MDNKEKVKFCSIILGMIILFTFLISSGHKEMKEQRNKIISMGYRDISDVAVFCNKIGASFKDFIESKSLRKQYEIFANGSTSDFIETAIDTKIKEDTASRAHATGMATGMAIGVNIK